MRKLILVAHISIDGFVAGLQGELDGFPSGDENLEFVCRLTDDADAAIFGRVSYELLNGFWPKAKDLPHATKNQVEYSNWYNRAEKIVCSGRLTIENINHTSIINDNISKEILSLKQQQGKNILIFGSPSISQVLIQFNLIDEYWIFINPVLFGKGIPLFKDSPDNVNLHLIETKQFANGEMAIHYLIQKRI